MSFKLTYGNIYLGLADSKSCQLPTVPSGFTDPSPMFLFFHIHGNYSTASMADSIYQVQEKIFVFVYIYLALTLIPLLKGTSGSILSQTIIKT